MFLKNANGLRRNAVIVLVLVVNLAGVWPLLSQSTARSVDLFQRYSEFMEAGQALEQVLGGVEFCGDAPAAEQPADWEAQSPVNDGKLILLGQAPSVIAPLKVAIERPREELIPGRMAGLPDTPPPRV